MTEPVPSTARLLRLIVPKPEYVGDDQAAPTYLAFRPNSGDRQEAADGHHPVRVSVWDLAKASLTQVESIRGRADGLPFAISAQDVTAVAKEAGGERMRVLYAPLAPPHADLPGAGGHVGIEGLDQGPTEPKNLWNSRLAKLARRLIPYEPPE